MSLILSIESGTDICSVGIARNGEIIALRESVEGRDHARLVATFADELFQEVGISARDLSAVAVSQGPGSYTGLRIGVSFAKGLCYGSNIPLIGVNSLESLVQNAIDGRASGRFIIDEEVWHNARLVPMVDARRMEVYTQIYNTSCEAEGGVESKIIDEGSYLSFRGDESRSMILFGNGASKCVDLLPGVYFVDVSPSASGVARLAARIYERSMTETKDLKVTTDLKVTKNLTEPNRDKGESGLFTDVAYFEPFYLKDAAITLSKKRYF